jgi:hypothetical protein
MEVLPVRIKLFIMAKRIVGMLPVAFVVTHNLVFLSSPYNYVHLAAYVTPMIGCLISLDAKPTVREDTGVDGGPRQVWILAFAILLIYLNIVRIS